MTWEQKFAAINAIADASLRMREPGDWYVSQPRVEVKAGSILTGSYGNGRTPEAAIEAHWRALTQLEGDSYVVVDAYKDERKAVEWNGFMWVEIREREK